MFNFKKILFLMLCIILTLAIVACNNDEQSEPSSSPVSESQSETETQKPENAVTVKFDTQGGTQIDDAIIEKGENVPKPTDPEKAGYTFDGWYVENEKWSFLGYVVTNDITLTAKWTPIEYTVTFAGNVTNSSIKYTIADSFDLPNGNAKYYYEFEGWFEDEALTKPISKIEKGTYGNKTIYAKTAYSGFTFTLKNGEYSVTKCASNATEIVIPSTYQGKSVTSIGNEAFRDCASLTSITIPDSVTKIGWDAFRDCTSLTSVTIPNSVTSIGGEAFYNCTSLTSVTIPNSVTSIGGSAFFRCTSLTSITIGNSVTSIGSSVFYNCTSLTSVTIGNSVTSIGSHAFSGCPIENATIPTVAISYIPKSELKTVVISGGDSIGNSAFKNCTSLTSVTIGDSVTTIGNNAFNGCTKLTSATIPNSVTTIGDSAFQGCTSLTSVTIPNSVTTIGSDAFSNCTSLTSVTIGDSVTSIGNSAFDGCTSLTGITIPNSVTSIGEYAFYRCSKLTIYCEATSEPSGWDPLWNPSNRPVYWYRESKPSTSGNFWHYGTNGEIVIWE